VKKWLVPIFLLAVLGMTAGPALCGYPQYCPLYKVMELSPGIWYWAFDRHDDPPGDLCNDPSRIYAIAGELEIRECPNCGMKKAAAGKKSTPAKKKAADSPCGCAATDSSSTGSREYVGLEKPVDPDYQYQFPDATSRKYGWVVDDHKIPYIKFETDEPTPKIVYAKVFLLAMDIKELLGKPGAPPKLMYLALEANVKKPPEGTVEMAMEPMDKVSGPVSPATASVYSGEFRRFGDNVCVMAILAAEKPPTK
jgi:hypothetical protein